MDIKEKDFQYFEGRYKPVDKRGIDPKEFTRLTKIKDWRLGGTL